MLVTPCDRRPRLQIYGERCFQFAGRKEWNNLPLLYPKKTSKNPGPNLWPCLPIQESPSIYIFKACLKTYLFNCAFKL